MNLQYISDQNGTHKSVIIPIEDWNRIKEKYDNLEEELGNSVYPLSNKQEKAIDIALNSLEKNGSISNDAVAEETRKKYPQLFKNK